MVTTSVVAPVPALERSEGSSPAFFGAGDNAATEIGLTLIGEAQ